MIREISSITAAPRFRRAAVGKNSNGNAQMRSKSASFTRMRGIRSPCIRLFQFVALNIDVNHGYVMVVRQQ
jgi:hypothetical protein